MSLHVNLFAGTQTELLVGEYCRGHSSDYALICSKTLKWHRSVKTKPLRRQIQAAAAAATAQLYFVSVCVCVLYTHCYQVGGVIYVYIRYRDFYECIYMDVLSVSW